MKSTGLCKSKYFFVLLLMFATQLFRAQTVDLSSPRATVFTHLNNLKPDSYHPEIAGKTIYGFTGDAAAQKAVRLKYIYEGKGVFIEFTDIPNNTDYTDSINFPIPKHAYKPFPYRLPDVYLEKYGNHWYYSKNTIAKIDYLYRQIYPFGADLIYQFVPNYLKTKLLGLSLWQWLGLFIVIILTYFLHILFKKILFLILKFIKKKIIHFPILNLDERLKQFAHPLSYIFGIYVMKMMVPYLLLGQKFGNWLISSLNFAEIIFWIFVFLKLVDVFITVFKHYSGQTESRLDDQLIPILKNTLKGLVLLFGMFKILIVLGADPKAIIAGASIGGLAVGLAAQDTVKNLLGTLMIFIDKPFKIGDWIIVDGIEGSVEEVGFRSSIIRAADTSVFKIPNSKLSEVAVNNMGKRIYRRYKTTLGIRYDTPPHLIETFVEGIKKIIELHPTTRNYSNYTPYNSVPYNVEFIEYGDSSLNILLNVYFMTNDYAEEMHGRHILLLGILKLANSLGVEFAFPSQTLFMELFPGQKPAYPKYQTDKQFIDKVMNEVIEEFKNKITKY
jgi:MscS family membrane protein